MRRYTPLAIRLSAFLDSKDILSLVTAMSEKLTELGTKFSQILLGGISFIQIWVDYVEYFENSCSSSSEADTKLKIGFSFNFSWLKGLRCRTFTGSTHSVTDSFRPG